MQWEAGLSIRTISPENRSDRSALEAFLHEQGLFLEEDIDYSLGVFKEDEMLATASIAGSVIKCVAVRDDFQGYDLSAKLLSYLKIYAYHKDIDTLFLFTLPKNRSLFASLGFYTVAETEDVLLMEDNSRNLNRYLEGLKALNPGGTSAASLVMNCNPFTLGHRYLIEKAARENELLLLFLVQEDRSLFPFETRFRLVREGIADLDNVKLISGGPYIISSATFPSYFIKDKTRTASIQTELDLTIFAGQIAPAAGICRRYVGEEPFCPLTASYNTAMKELLPEYGIELLEIPRLEAGSSAVSASHVRQEIGQDNMDAVKELVPETTYRYLISDEAADLRKILKEKYDADHKERHRGDPGVQ